MTNVNYTTNFVEIVIMTSNSAKFNNFHRVSKSIIDLEVIPSIHQLEIITAMNYAFRNTFT